MAVLVIIFFVLVSVLVYAWAVYYGLLCLARSLMRGSACRVPDGNCGELPELSIIIAAYNEAGVIGARVLNLLAVDYPADKLHIYIGCDGCSDATAANARQAAGGDVRVRVLEYADNRGKVSVLKDLVKLAQDEVCGVSECGHLLAFSDANTMFASDALNKLVRWFADSQVGGVCGRLVFVDGSANENPAQEGAYWRMETRLKQLESHIDSCLGANGAIYAIRSELFWQEIPADTIVDDFVIGMKVREQGFGMLYDAEAVARERLPEISDEWVRRVRIGLGDYQAAGLCARCLLPRYGWFAWCFWSHKILRWFTPHVMLLMLALGGLIAIEALTSSRMDLSVMAVLAVSSAMILLVGIALLGQLVRGRELKSLPWRMVEVCSHFVTMNAALFAGFIRFCGGGRSGAWRRTPRSE